MWKYCSWIYRNNAKLTAIKTTKYCGVLFSVFFPKTIHQILKFSKLCEQSSWYMLTILFVVFCVIRKKCTYFNNCFISNKRIKTCISSYNIGEQKRCRDRMTLLLVYKFLTPPHSSSGCQDKKRITTPSLVVCCNTR